MTIAQSLLPEFDAEMEATRRVLERVPEGNPDWKPHPKSMPLGRLATLVAEMPGWTVSILTESVLKIPAGYQPNVVTTRAELLDLFDNNVTSARDTISKTPDAEFDKTWGLEWDGQMAFEDPKPVVYRRMLMNHVVHHRAQLMVYLRLNDVPVPGVYGASADEHG
jgi:uncharacterized damage-inducible protein DinB